MSPTSALVRTLHKYAQQLERVGVLQPVVPAGRTLRGGGGGLRGGD